MRLRSVAAAICLLPALACAQPVDGATITAPHYGDALFHFYQGRYFSSVTGLMASQQLQRVSPHDDEAEVLRGGLLLSYGLHDEAGRIFAALVDQTAKASVRDRAWFYLAKIRYQRERFADAEEALERIGQALPPELQDERALLRANVLLAREQPARAAEVLETLLPRSAAASRYARYNLGIALVRSGQEARGRALLDTLGRETMPDEEARTLRDRANVALGFAALGAGDFEAARSALQRVRLASSDANKALLGFGWAAASLKQPAKALVPWSELVGRGGPDAAVLEARIAVPYAYAELGATGQALARYEDAITAFEQESAAIDQAIVAIRAGKLVDGLMQRNPGEGMGEGTGQEMGWFWNLRNLPELPYAANLAPVLASHAFQEAFKNYRDLRFLEGNLTHWREQLVVFDAMLANRRAGYAERLPGVLAKARDITLAPLLKQREALAAEIGRAEQQTDGVAYATTRERELAERIARAKAAIAALGGEADDGMRQRARLAEGALTWDLARALPERRWDARKGLRALDAGIAEAQRRVEAVARAQRDEPARHAAFAERIAALGKRIDRSLPVVTTLAREQQGEVQQIAVAALEAQKERIAAYAAQARFAVAQLYDRATVVSQGDRAPVGSVGGGDAPAR
jgi:chorismate mutase